MPRIPVKSTEKLAFAEERGKLKAKQQALKKEGVSEKFERLLPIIIHNSDKIIDGLAIISGTIIVHDIIFKTDEFLASAKAWTLSSNVQTKLFASGMTPFMGLPFGGMALEFLKTFMPEDIMKQVWGETTEEQKQSFQSQDWFLWLMAFGISYFAVKHGDDLLNVARMFTGMRIP